MRYLINLSYDGSATNGYQIQPKVPTVQGHLEKALSTLLGGAKVPVLGAGRTDTSVNAVGYVAQFDWDGELPLSCRDLTYKLSAILPREIVIHSVCEAPRPDFHARFDATARTYRYFIHFRKNPFVEKYSWRCHYALDMDAMNRACSFLLGRHDFSCFEKTGGNNATSLCTITEAHWDFYTPDCVSQLGFPEGGERTPGEGHAFSSEAAGPDAQARAVTGDYIVFTVRADRFLRNMVRAIVGTMVEVGRGRKPAEWVQELIATGTRSDAGESVTGNALFLCKVEY